MKNAEAAVEKSLLLARWLLLPLYAILMVILLVFAVKAVQELLHLVEVLLEIDEAHLVLAVLSLIDMVLVANLLVMVALSGYETFISPFDTIGELERPGWLGKLDPGTVKLKVAASIVAISAIHLLKQYMSMIGPAGKEGALVAYEGLSPQSEHILVLTGVHLAFVVSALLLAWIDRMSFKGAH